MACCGMAHPQYPGAILREDVIPALGRPKSEIARLLRISRRSLYDILEGKQPITPQMALRIGKLCGNGAEVWLAMQRAYDLSVAADEIADDLAQIPTLQAA